MSPAYFQIRQIAVFRSELVFRISCATIDMPRETRDVFRSPLLRAAVALIHNTSTRRRHRPCPDKERLFSIVTWQSINQEHKANRDCRNYIADLCALAVDSFRLIHSEQTTSQHVYNRVIISILSHRGCSDACPFPPPDNNIPSQYSTLDLCPLDIYQLTISARQFIFAVNVPHLLIFRATHQQPARIDQKIANIVKSNCTSTSMRGICNEQYGPRFTSDERLVIVIGYWYLWN